MLTSDVLLQPQLVQHHLQTLLVTPQRQGIENGGVAYISTPSSKLLQA
jgi:hypothetical protein